MSKNDLAERLRHQADNVENDGHLNASRYMREAADQLSTTTELLEALKNATATIRAIYEWVERVENNGGATSISGISSCHAMLTSLRKNAKRTDQVVLEPARLAILNAENAHDP